MQNNEYLDVFIEESKEHLQSLNDQLLILENDSENLDTISEIFRSAHTLKGMAATMGFNDLANLTHKMENILDAIRNDQLKIHTHIIDVLFSAVDHLEDMVVDIAEGGNGAKDVIDVIEQLNVIENGEETKSVSDKTEQLPTTEPSLAGENHFHALNEFELTVLEQAYEKSFHTYEVKVSLNENCLLKAARVYMVFEVLEQIGEVVKADPTIQDLEEENFELSFHVLLISQESPENIEKRILKVSEIEHIDVRSYTIQTKKANNEMGEEKSTSTNEVTTNNEAQSSDDEKNKQKKNVVTKTIRVNINRLDGLMNLFEELVIDRGRLEQISGELNHSELNETVERMTRITGDLQTLILNMRMVPIEQVFNRFPRMVRQLSKDLGKKINLEIIGAETELDRTVIDEIGDPLVHLIRNGLDHGIEMPEVRKANGKPEEGNLTLKAYHSGNHVFIEISDDGAGIKRENILKKAIANHIVTEEEGQALSDKEVYQLMMASGFSTAEQISDISGRGVGLDVVKNTIESLGGSISISSEEGAGSTFSVQLPLTLSIITVLLVEVGDEKYAVPLSSIIETAVIPRSEIYNAHNKQVIDFRGKVVPLISLKEVFNVPEASDEDEFLSIVIIRKGDKMAGLIVDTFIGQQEIVLKSLGDYLGEVFAISGATILGDGQVALIIDTNALIN
ncbi:two-component system chemotaxis sensor kinase CheA [Gracilibacillus halotolerans]|uniref:Chemotaxis protein CheA n=1 Tax=Gracilibacillus halotolerans TaxID=74386 RepID=A0A841RG65_9BACI|nr:chemotaxis protein CheA [Gracilibacillus halotolerans]MBB6511459.1 two-component system chemotaxis sensor kinase CheA [Gracilibacillus halotolerans]